MGGHVLTGQESIATSRSRSGLLKLIEILVGKGVLRDEKYPPTNITILNAQIYSKLRNFPRFLESLLYLWEAPLPTSSRMVSSKENEKGGVRSFYKSTF